MNQLWEATEAKVSATQLFLPALQQSLGAHHSFIISCRTMAVVCRGGTTIW